jgi:type II secretory pathway component PulF
MAELDEPELTRLSAEEAAQLGAQLSGLAKAGLPLPSGLMALAGELPAGRLRRSIEQLSRTLEGGTSLERAIDHQGRAFPTHLAGLVRAGERTGKTGDVLGRFAGFSYIGVEVRRQLWLSLAYPFLSLVFACLLITFILAFLVHDFDAIFRDFGIPLPGFSRLLIRMSNAIRYSWSWLSTGVIAIASLGIVASFVSGPAWRRGVAKRIPLSGPVWHSTSLAEFCHLLGLLLESEVPLVEAVALAGDGVVDRDAHAAGRALRRDLERGDTLTASMARRSFFPGGVVSIVAWAEQNRCLPRALGMLGAMFEARARTQAQFASTVCSVLTMLAILLCVAAILVGVFGPLIQLIRSLSG